jgi:hypothetical protein
MSNPSETTRYGSIRSDWKPFPILNAAPTKAVQFLDAPDGDKMEVMIRLAGGVLNAECAIYRYALIGSTVCIAEVSRTTLDGDASDPMCHVVTATHNGDRVCVTIEPHGGSNPSSSIAAYRYF